MRKTRHFTATVYVLHDGKVLLHTHPSFSIFGPTKSDIFKPLGKKHFAYQGKCPYGKTFEKTCPILRTCSSGACIRELGVDEIFDAFIHWWTDLKGDTE